MGDETSKPEDAGGAENAWERASKLKERRREAARRGAATRKRNREADKRYAFLGREYVGEREVVRGERSGGAVVIQFPMDRARLSSSPLKPVFNLGYSEAETGQRALDFDGLRAPRKPCEVVQLRSASRGRDAERAYNLYCKASTLDEDPGTYDEAQRLYELAIHLDPLLAIAEVNLGNIFFRRGRVSEAEALYRHAISVQYHSPEAHYNLGYLMLERGDAAAALALFEVSLSQDCRFANAAFNAAMAEEQLGQRSAARRHWKMYLDLEPAGTWADIARKHLA